MARARSTQDYDTAVDTQPEFASHQDVPTTQAATGRPVKRVRVGVVLLTVLVTELVLIAAGLNQAVAKHVDAYATKHPDSLLGHAVRSLLVLRWRFSPANGQSDLWHTELITFGLVLLLGIVLVPLLVHGPMSWLRAFVGTWFAVIIGVVVATVAAVVLADLEESRDLASYVVPGTPSTGLSIGTQIGDAVFGPLLAYAFVAGVGLGLVTALVVSIVAVSTRRTDAVAVVAAAEPETLHTPDSPQPFFGNTTEDEPRRGASGYDGGYGTSSYGTSSGYGTSAYGSGGYGTTSPYEPAPTRADASSRHDTEATTAFPSSPSGSDQARDSTTALPRVSDGREPAASGSADATSELPRSEREPATSSAARDSADDRTQAWPAQPEASDGAENAENPDAEKPDAAKTAGAGDPDQTAAFPIPPDDEDLGRQPDRADD